MYLLLIKVYTDIDNALKHDFSEWPIAKARSRAELVRNATYRLVRLKEIAAKSLAQLRQSTAQNGPTSDHHLKLARLQIETRVKTVQDWITRVMAACETTWANLGVYVEQALDNLACEVNDIADEPGRCSHNSITGATE